MSQSHAVIKRYIPRVFFLRVLRFLTIFWDCMCSNKYLLCLYGCFAQRRDHPLFKEDEINTIKSIYSQTITTLAKNSKLRQRVAATAIVYFKRFFLRNAIRDHDPRLIAPVALVSLPLLYISARCAKTPKLTLRSCFLHLLALFSTSQQSLKNTRCLQKSSSRRCYLSMWATIRIPTPLRTSMTTSSR